MRCQSRQYGLAVRGKSITADQVDTLDGLFLAMCLRCCFQQVERLYACYEAGLGAVMTKMLGSAALQLYAGVASMFLPIPVQNQPGLIADLESDPFVGHALSTTVCELYHRFGVILALLTVGVTTMKHCQFGHQCPPMVIDEDNGEQRTGIEQQPQRGRVVGASD